MPPPAQSEVEDAANGEAWFQKGVALLDRRKEERALEARLKRAMNCSVIQQWQMLPALLTGAMIFCQQPTQSSPWMLGLNVVMIVFWILSAIDRAQAKRTQALLEWIQYREERKQE